MIKNCSQCGLCCQLFLINLNKKEYYSEKYKTELESFGVLNNFKKAVKYGANILKQKKNGGCIYLKDNKCLIHQTRPQVCREFFCNSKSKKFKEMIEKIEKNRS
jgi:Fe-S-cluster containining protein